MYGKTIEYNGEHLGPATGLLLILIKFVSCGKCCVRIDKCVFIIVKIKCVNFDKISDICDKVNFITNYTHYTTPDNILSKLIQILQFLTPLEGRSHSGT